jgi:hypothetical protein
LNIREGDVVIVEASRALHGYPAVRQSLNRIRAPRDQSVKELNRGPPLEDPVEGTFKASELPVEPWQHTCLHLSNSLAG